MSKIIEILKNYFLIPLLNIPSKIWGFVLGKKFWTLLILMIISGAVYFSFFRASTASKAEEIKVVRKNLEEAVSLTGRVKPTAEAVVTFEKSGTIRAVNVKSGDRVTAGETLATLSADDAYARVAESKAALDGQLAILADLISGAKEEQINLKKITIERSQSDIAQGYNTIQDTLRNVNISASDIVKVNFSRYFDGSTSAGYRINVNSCESQTESRINTAKDASEVAIKNLETIYNNYSSLTEESNKKAEISKVRSEMAVITNFLNEMKNLFSANCMTGNPNYDSARSLITSSRSGWSSLLLDINSKNNTISTLEITLRQAKEDLKLLESGEKSEKIRQQEASVAGARARLAQSASDAAKNVLKAPFNGIITAVDVKTGEYASVGGLKSISLISDASFEIESKVSEVDVAKVKVGDKSQITFDAYGSEVKFEATITNISPAGVITDGVPTYKTVFSFVERDDRIRSGMTANIDVVTKVHENVLVLPARAVKNEKGVRKVKVKIGKDIKDKDVKIGARGVSGEVEMTEGVVEGDIVVIEAIAK
jgi:multidrug resistance efflux pump